MLPDQACPALVLNADFRPLSYFPLSTWTWQEAVRAVFLDRVDTVAEYDEVVRSPSFEMRLPSVVALRDYQPLDRRPAFTRFNLWLRDGGSCAYCDAKLAPSGFTFDHVVPRSRGGKTTWENIVTACTPCNMRKGDKMLSEAGMVLLRQPTAPTIEDINKMGRKLASRKRSLHKTWVDFLYWDSELEEA